VLVWCVAERTDAVEAALRREADGWADVLRARFAAAGGRRPAVTRRVPDGGDPRRLRGA
jgi:hypothetical protein